MLYTGKNIHSLAELPLVHHTCIPSPQVRIIYWNFVVATTGSYYSMTGLSTFSPSLPPVCAIWTVHLQWW